MKKNNFISHFGLKKGTKEHFMKKITLYHIFGLRKGTKEHFMTKICFKSEEQAKNYCNYLNRENVQGSWAHFSYLMEDMEVYRSPLDLVNDANEDAKLLSQCETVEFFPGE